MTQSFQETIQSFTAKTYWEALVDTGWVNFLSPAEQNSLQHSLEAHFERYPQQAWTALATVVFDSEGFYLAEDYTDLLAQFSDGSFGRFIPAHVTAVEEDDLFKVGFVLGNRAYQAELSATNDYFDEKLVTRINQALAGQGTAEQFILLPVFDQTCHYAFTTPQAVQAAKDRLLIPADIAPLPGQITPTQPIRGLSLTKAQFALLMARAVGDPFVLDEAALDDLGLSEQDVVDAEKKLIRDGHLQYGGEVPVGLADLLATAVTPGWKCIIQPRAEHPEWMQLAVHFAETLITGEALKRDEERLLTQFDTVKDAIDWLLDLLPGAAEDGELSPPLALETLLPQAQMMIAFLIVNTAEAEDGTRAAVMWLLTDGGLWFIDNQADEELAVNVTNAGLHDRLRNLVNRHIPQPVRAG